MPSSRSAVKFSSSSDVSRFSYVRLRRYSCAFLSHTLSMYANSLFGISGSVPSVSFSKRSSQASCRMSLASYSGILKRCVNIIITFDRVFSSNSFMISKYSLFIIAKSLSNCSAKIGKIFKSSKFFRDFLHFSTHFFSQITFFTQKRRCFCVIFTQNNIPFLHIPSLSAKYR